MTKPEDRVRALLDAPPETLVPDEIVRRYLSMRGGDVWRAARDIRHVLLGPEPTPRRGGGR